MSAKIAWITLAAVIAYCVSVDENVLRWLYLWSQRVGVIAQKVHYHVWDSPLSPIRRVLIEVNANRLARELQKELSEKKRDD